MDQDQAKPAAPRIAQAAPLVKALNQSVQVKERVEQCAQELASVNEVLKHEVSEHLPLDQVEGALQKSEEVEVRVQECADDLALVNQALGREIGQRKKLERALATGKTELADTQAELSEIQQHEKRARHLALHDFVSGLPNRTLLNDRLNSALALAQRHAWQVAVMFIDLDKFNRITDVHGHAAGDEVIKIISERLQKSARASDTVGRQGGDEFLYLMLEVTDEAAVATAAAKLTASLRAPCEFNGINVSVKASIGIAMYPQHGTSANVLLENADKAMYEAKAGNTGFAFYRRDSTAVS